MYNKPPNVVTFDKKGIIWLLGGWYRNVTTTKNSRYNM